MPNPHRHLPQETLDCIIDLLHDELNTLKQCCLVSKSWISRTRKHIFADIRFRSADDLDSWRKTFPDPSTSPAYHTHTLTTCCTQAIMAGAEADGWITTFSRVVRLRLNDTTKLDDHSKITLSPFHKFSPTLKSLRVDSETISYPQIFSLVRSFPLLEDLSMFGRSPWKNEDNIHHGTQAVVPSASEPALNGSLELVLPGGLGYATQRLVELPGGLRFRKLVLSWFCQRDLRRIVELVVRCSDTLECLDITRNPFSGASPASVDLSKATKLKDAVFRPRLWIVSWIVIALQTITSKHRDLRQISIYIPDSFASINVGNDVEKVVGEAIYALSLDLDRLLVQFWESRSVRPRLIHTVQEKGKQNMEYCVGRLLPEITKRGIVDLVWH